MYDPGDPNDRMLLGLKGTMSEVELHTSTVTVFTHPAGRVVVGTPPLRRTNGRSEPLRSDAGRG